MLNFFDRRKFLAYLATVPVISDWTEALGYARPKQLVRDQRWKDRFLAVEILRLINTAEKWNFLDTNQHVSKERLHECIGYKKLIEKIPVRFQHVVNKFPSTGTFEVPGWDIYVAPNTDLSKYVAAVSMKGPEYTFAFVSDELGTIYEGRPVGTQSGYAEINELLSAARGKEINTLTPNEETRWWPKLLTTIMFSPFLGFAILPRQLNQGCACCTGMPCLVPGGCQCFSDCPNNCPSGESHCCVNCGTCGCTWVRESSCETLCNCYNGGCPLECCFEISGGCLCECG